jgi:hypothetical protein
MDISTSKGRVQMMHNTKLFTDIDLYNIQLFIHKLDMRFNDPIDGPSTQGLRKLFLGQRGLTPLCNLLKRKAYLDLMDVVKLAVRYSYIPPINRGWPVFGIPPEEIGIGHLEGWGAGKVHLIRPDELVMRESVRRHLGLKQHITQMMLWGYVDPITGENIKVSEEEMYMSDEEGVQKRERPEGWGDYWDVEEPVGNEWWQEEEGDDDEISDDEEDGEDDSGEDDSGEDDSEEDSSGEDGSGENSSGEDSSGEDSSGEDSSGEDSSGEDDGEGREEDSESDEDYEMDHDADLDNYYFGSGAT